MDVEGVFAFIGVLFMVKYFCGGCWNEIDKDETICIHCGADQSKFEEEAFVAKLIRALNHREPQTPIRAAYILGKLKAREAITALLKVIHESADMFLVAAAVEALGEIGDRSLEPRLRETLTSYPSPIVRRAVHRALKMLELKGHEDER